MLRNSEVTSDPIPLHSPESDQVLPGTTPKHCQSIYDQLPLFGLHSTVTKMETSFDKMSQYFICYCLNRTIEILIMCRNMSITLPMLRVTMILCEHVTGPNRHLHHVRSYQSLAPAGGGGRAVQRLGGVKDQQVDAAVAEQRQQHGLVLRVPAPVPHADSHLRCADTIYTCIHIHT